jgi:lipopolysaccharide/colanic/teichoic acid biosynthesis glycosyltransferase
MELSARAFFSVTLELDHPAAASLAARVLWPAPRPRAVAPWLLPAGAFDALEPRSAYGRLVREPLLLGLAVLLAPLGLLLAVPIALVNAWVQGSVRRVFFAQIRVGRRGAPFVLYKFRTMRDHPGGDGARVTRFGRFLRNTHLDELPQLVNVLRGEMCLIGPRPELLATERWAARRIPGFAERLVLAPGLTGLAQITQGYTDGGDEEAYRQKCAWNQRYRAELSFALDAAILLRTVAWMLRRRGWRRG